jgi:hypothetical protein
MMPDIRMRPLSALATLFDEMPAADTHPHVERVEELIVTNAVLGILATAFMVARMIAKRMRHLGWTWDDTLVTIGLV